MKRLLTRVEIERILLGSSWFGTGGGLTLAEQRAQAARLTGPVHLVTPADLNPGALVCCAYGVGPAGGGTAGIIEAFQRAMEILRGVTGGAPIAALFPAEANIAGAVFELAGELNLPVLDGDTTGGRAVPEIRIDNFVLHGRTVTPLVAVSSRGEEIVIVEPKAAADLEAIVRPLATNAVVGVLDHPITAEVAAETLTLGTLSRAERVGRVIEELQRGAASLSEVLAAAAAWPVCSGTLTRVELGRREGFLAGVVELTSSVHGRVEITVKNEYLTCRGEGIPTLTAPDLIILIDPATGLGRHSASLHPGEPVAVAGIAATPLWATPAGRAVWGLD